MNKKKLCIITGSRAEWGLFYPLAKEIKKNKDIFSLRIIATGPHLLADSGLTYKEIEDDGFRIDNKVKILLSGDKEETIAKTVSAGITKLTNILKIQRPDLVFLLGDRFETFSAVVACFFLKIPIAHIHGGELTEASLDDAIRHAITKMSYLHFVSTDTYGKRVIQLGESPNRVFNVGALAVDNIRSTRLFSKKEVEKEINFKLGKRNILVTFSPPTLEKRSVSERQFRSILSAVDEIKDAKIIFTKPNPDIYSRSISRLLNRYVYKNKDKALSLTSMGRRLYLSTLQFMDVVVGNSSSGIIEVPYFGIATINIGDRQKGRLTLISVINVRSNPKFIKRALRKAFSVDFRKLCRKSILEHPYGDGKAARRIVGVIKRIDLSNLKKRFFDVDFTYKEAGIYRFKYRGS